MKFVRSYHVAQLGRNVIKPTLLQVAVVRPESNFINAYEGLLKYGLEVAHFERNKWLTLERNMHYLPDHVGRCDRESNCGYHYTVKQYLKENGVKYEASILESPEIIEPEVIDRMPLEYVSRSLKGYMESNFALFLRSIISDDYAEQVLLKYYVGRSNIEDGKACIFWRIDRDENVRTGKIIFYNPVTGKRDKEKNPTWVHSFIKPFRYKLCFFGEHLLTEYPKPLLEL